MTPPGAIVLAFAGMGATAASLGTLLPVLATRLDTSPAVLSLATSFLFGGLLVGVAVAVVASRGVAVGALLAAGAAVQAGALVGLAVAPTTGAVHLAALVLGTGFGATEVTASVVAGQGAQGSAHLAMVTAVFAAAAILTPVLMALSLATTGTAVAAALVVACLHAGAVLGVRGIPGNVGPSPGAHTAAPAPRPARDRRAVVATTAVLVAYVGAEATLATWSGELARTLLGLSPAAAAIAPTAFWICLLVGRLVAARLLRRVDARQVLLGTLALGATAALAGAVVSPVAGLLALALLGVTGASMGPVYGVTLSFGARPTGGTPMTRTGLLIGVGAVGGATIPAMIAVVAAAGATAVAGAIGVFLVVATVVATRIPLAAPSTGAATEPA